MLDFEVGVSALRLWVAAGSAALLVACCGVTFVLPTTRTVEVTRAILVALGAVLGASITWAFLGGSSNASSERRALEQQAAELAARTLAPGSPLACLDALAGESVEAACDKAIFASPASVAAATSYVAARLALLSDIAAYAGRGSAAIEASMPLRRALETDRFGFLAHLLATRDNCTSENCKTLALLRDPSHVRANLREETFNHYLERYLLVWAREAEPAIAAAPQVQAAAPVTVQANSAGPAQSGQHRLSERGIDPGGQHNEFRAVGSGAARRRRNGACQSEPAAEGAGFVAPLAQAGRYSAGTGSRALPAAWGASGGRTDLAPAAAAIACAPGRNSTGAAQSSSCATTGRER